MTQQMARDTQLGIDPRTNEPLDLSHSPLMQALEAMLEDTGFSWSLSLIGEDQAHKLAMLTGDLRRRISPTGDGKRIDSGFSYLGTEPAIAWVNACRDHLYPVMKQSIESFDRRWAKLRSGLDEQRYHYVSLGPGDGQKDAVILQDMRRDNAELCYVAVDMSTEMLRLGVNALTRQLKFSRGRILPVQLDFSSQENIIELRRLLDGMFGGEPILFSLLGNTLANFENDTELLRMIAERLLRPQDKFILEVATTRQLDDALAQEATEEYERSRTFREFVTSALMHYTDLRIDMDSVLFEGSVEEGRALLIKVIYRNTTEQEIRITLPDRTDVSFPAHDTIRLYLSRKYTQDGLDRLFNECNLQQRSGNHFKFTNTRDSVPFGMDLLALTANPESTSPASIMVEGIWRR